MKKEIKTNAEVEKAIQLYTSVASVLSEKDPNKSHEKEDKKLAKVYFLLAKALVYIGKY